MRIEFNQGGGYWKELHYYWWELPRTREDLIILLEGLYLVTGKPAATSSASFQEYRIRLPKEALPVPIQRIEICRSNYSTYDNETKNKVKKP